MTFETLLFHTRFRELAFNSLKSVLQLKAAGLKKVVLAHVIPREDVEFVPYGGTLKEDEDRIREEARLKFDDWIQTIGDPQLEFHQRITVKTGCVDLFEVCHHGRLVDHRQIVKRSSGVEQVGIVGRVFAYEC